MISLIIRGNINKLKVIEQSPALFIQMKAFKTDRKPTENPRKPSENPRKPSENPRQLDTTHHHRVFESHVTVKKESVQNDDLEKKQDVFYYVESPLAHRLNDVAIPVAIILGWSASTDKHMVKYADIYKDFGYHTIRISLSLATAIIKTKEHDKLALELVKLIKTHVQLSNNPIVIHTFSNAGTFIFRHFLEYIEDVDEYSALKANIKCLIHDSGPGDSKDYFDSIKNIVKLVEKNVKNIYVATLITVIGLVAGLFKYMRTNYLNETMNRLAKDANGIPTLFLYSKTDRLISHENVSAFIAKRKEVLPDLKINSCVFEDSEHVSHYVTHKDVYLTKVKEHLIESNLPIFYANSKHLK
jgi:hypothetical protein